MTLTENKNLTESDLRPQEQYKQWQDILRNEVDQLLANKVSLIEVDCPACQNSKKEPVFIKFGLQYYSCDKCGTVYASPRPSANSLDNFYSNSKAVKFWKEQIVSATQGQRLQKSWKPLYNWVNQITKSYYTKPKKAADFKPKYNSLFSLFDNLGIEDVSLVDPLLVDLKKTDTAILLDEFDQKNDKFDIITAFDVLDREFSPLDFIKKIADKLETGGLLFLTTNTISGFEYLILGENSTRLVPPDRLNLLSIEGLEDMLQKNGYEILDISTPGQLDIELVAKEYKQNPDMQMSSFMKYILKHRGESVRRSLQSFLQLNNLSSYLRAVARKK